MRRALVFLFAIASPAALAAGGYGFAGFSRDGSRFLKHGADDRECTVALPPVCQPVDRKGSRGAGFVKPPRTKKLAGEPVEALVEEGTVVVRAGDRVIGRFEPEAPAISVNSNVFVGADDALVAVEYEAKGAGADVVVFALAPAPAKEVAPAPAPAAPAPGGAPGNAYDRAMSKGGVWEQRM